MTTAAVVGTGFMGAAHTEALRRLGINIRGILGSSAESSATAADSLQLPVAYLDFESLLNDPAVDVVHLTTPNYLHFAQCTGLLEAGKHVICEKPLALSAAESAQLSALSQKHDHLVAAVNYNLRYYPMVIQAREYVRRGELGEVYAVRGAYQQDWLLYDTDWNWRIESQKGGPGRAIGDIGTHWMDMVGYVTGLEIETLIADLATFIPVRYASSRQTFERASAADEATPVTVDTEDWGSVLFHYKGGARGVMTVSQVNAGRRNQFTFEIAGSKASLMWDGERPNELWLGYRDQPNKHLLKDPAILSGRAQEMAAYPGGHAEGYPDTFKQLYAEIYAYIEAGDFGRPKYFPTFEDGHAELVYCDAILQSHQEKRWVTI
ncbi:MAG: Gfo/Idh/MocA family oxidoreductase [Ardenticatenaceae bacterium]|nr:Gfo/Idh/MocA family oxidoreductase [Ardenticatenaceae bacterium]